MEMLIRTCYVHVMLIFTKNNNYAQFAEIRIRRDLQKIEFIHCISAEGPGSSSIPEGPGGPFIPEGPGGPFIPEGPGGPYSPGGPGGPCISGDPQFEVSLEVSASGPSICAGTSGYLLGRDWQQ